MKKNTILKRISRVLAIAFCVTLSFGIFTSGAIAQTQKDETIYVELNHDGSVSQINVVNRLFSMDSEEEFIDYGEYSDVKNLSDSEVASIEDDKLVWSANDASNNGFYYQGTLEGELPYIIEISYFLNNNKVTADKLAGANGEIRLDININQNEKCPENVRSGIMAQAAISLDLTKVSNIVSDHSTNLVIGKTMTVSYMVLAGSDASFSVSFDASDFEMAGINITLIKSEISLPDNIADSLDDIESGFDEMSDGMGEMIDGTSELQEGLVDLVSATGELDTGLAAIERGGRSLKAGIKAYKDGIAEYEAGMAPLAAGSTEIKDGLMVLSSQGSGLTDGYTNIKNGLDGLDQGHAQLVTLAETILLTSTDPQVIALAEGVIAEQPAISELAAGMGPLNTGLAEYVGGVSALSTNYEAFDAGIAALPEAASALYGGISEIYSGMGQYVSGISLMSDGMHEYYTELKSLPDNVAELVDGQIEFRDGIDEAGEEIQTQIDNALPDENTSPVSFASPEKNKPFSVQYIMHTPPIEIPEEENSIEEIKDKKTIWDRFLDLFRSSK